MIDSTYTQHEHRVLSIARLYYGLYVAGRQSTDVDISDLEQAGRMAIFNIATKRPERLNSPAYVSAAIKYSCINEIKRMRHKRRQVYLTHSHDEEVPIIDLLPTRETAPDRLEHLDDLLYQVRQEFSPVEADALDALIQKCSDVYDLNLSAPPSTDTKDRVKVVTAMDLDNEEMMIYAQVLTGARVKFPHGYIFPENGGREKAKKYLTQLLKCMGMTIPEFAENDSKKKILERYRLASFYQTAYDWNISSFLSDLDPALSRVCFFRARKWTDISPTEISGMIQEMVSKIKKDPTKVSKNDFISNNLYGMLCQIFGSSPRLAVEFAYPNTYPQYAERARELREKYSKPPPNL